MLPWIDFLGVTACGGRGIYLTSQTKQKVLVEEDLELSDISDMLRLKRLWRLHRWVAYFGIVHLDKTHIQKSWSLFKYDSSFQWYLFGSIFYMQWLMQSPTYTNMHVHLFVSPASLWCNVFYSLQCTASARPCKVNNMHSAGTKVLYCKWKCAMCSILSRGLSGIHKNLV